jgi:hypothetical protein
LNGWLANFSMASMQQRSVGNIVGGGRREAGDAGDGERDVDAAWSGGCWAHGHGPERPAGRE